MLLCSVLRCCYIDNNIVGKAIRAALSVVLNLRAISKLSIMSIMVSASREVFECSVCNFCPYRKNLEWIQELFLLYVDPFRLHECLMLLYASPSAAVSSSRTLVITLDPVMHIGKNFVIELLYVK